MENKGFIELKVILRFGEINESVVCDGMENERVEFKFTLKCLNL